MKQIQLSWLRGYVTIKVIGYYPELFFDLCVRNHVRVWEIRKIDQTTCTGNVLLRDISLIRHLRKKTRYKLYFIKKRGSPFSLNRILIKRPLVIAIISSFLLLFYLSNLVWRVEITGVRPEIEQQIQASLADQGVYQGRLKFLIEPPNKVQKKLLEVHPELLWVGVQEKGTTYQLEAVEKTIVPERDVGKPSNIIASKDGVIVDMYVEKGKPLVGINDFVEKGETLVTGDLANKGEEEDSKDSEQPNYIAVKAEIYANTWYEVSLTIPLEAQYQTLTGEQSNKYRLGMGRFNIPIWGLFSKSYNTSQVETAKKPFNFLLWQLPIHFIREDIYQVENVEEERTIEQARSIGIKQAKQEIIQELGHEVEIRSEKILHESLENGKVNLHLYFTVKENIAKIKAIPQGD